MRLIKLLTFWFKKKKKCTSKAQYQLRHKRFKIAWHDLQGLVKKTKQNNNLLWKQFNYLLKEINISRYLRFIPFF